MNIWTTGIDYSTGEPLTKPATIAEFGARLQEALQKNIAALKQLQAGTIGPVTFRDEMERSGSIDAAHSVVCSGHLDFVLIVGGPEKIPFRFQSLLASFAAVGRVHFDSLDDLTEYVSKIIRIETASRPVVSRPVETHCTLQMDSRCPATGRSATAFPDFANHMLNRKPQTPVGREVTRMGGSETQDVSQVNPAPLFSRYSTGPAGVRLK
jgi:hypothetical protein